MIDRQQWQPLLRHELSSDCTRNLPTIKLVWTLTVTAPPHKASAAIDDVARALMGDEAVALLKAHPHCYPYPYPYR